ncbi:helix-turn-helix domain-containing protein [Roseburia sp. 831b]|uniref:helix-turn-helix domain-containing protein n=1 Tax=Roseburia sp. 831b TaxID=1261635 RepID=UPI000952E87E|nr:helix-turn-helix transcriptional regulator [Roseburia sp. 831b]WVK73819.1 helix-turn-helix transcriptional regulator [Roseburia sp. 831b]
MIIYKDILKKLSKSGYNTTRLRREKILPESVITRIRHNESISIDSLNTICKLTKLPVKDLIVYKEDATMKKFELIKKTVEISYKNRKEIQPGCAEADTDPELLQSFDSLKDAKAALKKYKTDIKKMSGYYLVTEYSVEENEYDEDGEFVSGTDIWCYSEMDRSDIEK